MEGMLLRTPMNFNTKYLKIAYSILIYIFSMKTFDNIPKSRDFFRTKYSYPNKNFLFLKIKKES